MENAAIVAENEIKLDLVESEDLSSEDLLIREEEDDVSSEELALIEKEDSTLDDTASDLSAFLDDSVRLYLKEIGAYPLLTPEEEIAIARRVDLGRAAGALLKDLPDDGTVSTEDLTDLGYIHEDFSILIGKNRNELQDYISDGKNAEEKMLNSNLRLVVSIARKYTGRGMVILDLIQEGNLGLMRALDKFDYRKGFKFSTYATWWIKQGISRAIADQARTIRVPVHMVESINKFIRVSRALVQELGRDPLPSEIAEALGVSKQKVEEMTKLVQDTVSLDTPLGEEEDTTLGDMVHDDKAVDPSDEAAYTLLKEQLDDALAHLTDREERVVRLRFGLDDGQAKTLEEIGQEFGVTRERIRQIEVKAIHKLQRKSSKVKLEDWMRA